MVYYFTSVEDGEYLIYMGRDKMENEVLLKYGWPEDVWFHVDDHSSAHVYLRLKPGQTVNDIPAKVLMECGQLVKANSIKGNKLDDITVIYTPFPNLRKESHMEDGAVGFRDEKAVHKIKVPTRNGPLLRKLEKTKREEFPDLRQQREDRDAEEERIKTHEKKTHAKAEAQAKKEAKAKAIEEANLKQYKDVMEKDELKTTNKDLKSKTAAEFEEDFW